MGQEILPWYLQHIPGEDVEFSVQKKQFFQNFFGIGLDELGNRRQDMGRLLKENGVTYNIHGDPHGSNRLWNLDLVPFLISKQEWERTEKGLQQRAILLDLILKDIYGDQQLVKEGLLPMELIYNHQGFLRECVGTMGNLKGTALALYSANMARSADGRIWVISDRTQAPSGYGYALENRLAFARLMPELFEELKVRWLSPFFHELNNTLSALSPNTQNNPKVVILTPGPNNETYFEHSYLSSYLGYTLVQGNDLMVRDNHVWLKTMSGLEKVDVILRRVDDIYCDPLEFKEDSQLGVPGLMQAVRMGNVRLANPLGSSILESPGLMPFLANICKRLLGEPLLIPNIASWWCGQPKELNYSLANLHKLVIKKIHRDGPGSNSVDGFGLSREGIEQMKLKIQAQPYLYVCQEKINFSQSPSWIGGNMEPRNALFRTFMVSKGNSFTAMKGGLTRIPNTNSDFLISGQLGGMSKDTWVLSPEPEHHQSNRNQKYPPQGFYQENTGLPSHTAEGLFWVGRYAERFLGNARFIRSVMQFMSEGNRLQFDADLQTEKRLLQAVTYYSYTYPGFFAKDASRKIKQPWPELKSVLLDAGKVGSLHFNFKLFYNGVYAVRDFWSMDTWRVLRSMEEEWDNIGARPDLGPVKLLTALDFQITTMVAFTGLNRESISREQAWILLDIGRKVEQSLLVINSLRATMVQVADENVLFGLMDTVLKSQECLVNYRYKYKAHIDHTLVIDFLLMDSKNPRSLLFLVERLQKQVENLPPKAGSSTMPPQERLLLEAFTLLKLTDRESLSKIDQKTGQYKNLGILLGKLYSLMSKVPEAISKVYFKHEMVQKQLYKKIKDA